MSGGAKYAETVPVLGENINVFGETYPSMDRSPILGFFHMMIRTMVGDSVCVSRYAYAYASAIYVAI